MFLCTAAVTRAQSATLTGTVSDESDGLPLPGANVILLDAAGAQVTGGATDIDGRYTIRQIPAGAYTVRVRFVGYLETDIAVTLAAGETRTLDIALPQGGFELNPVTVTASRRQEKALDAPASVSILSAREIEANVGASSVDALRNTTGVDMAQTGIDRRELVLRGFNNAFSGATYTLTDYRQAAVASLGVNIFSIMPNMNIDIDRVEVVRGPGSALYGAGVDAGVVHFITKDPFSHPGTTVSVSGGERSLLGFQARHAGVIGGTLGYKITGMYGQADDWELDPNDDLDALQIAADGVRETDFQKYNVNGTLEYRPNDHVSVIANGGTSSLNAAVLSGIGTLQADGFGYSYGQLRLQVDNFFAQVYVNKNSAGDSRVYGGSTVVDNGALYNAQAQYDLSLADGKQQFIFGTDLELTRPDTKGTILGRNEDNDSVSEYGVYVQSTTALSPMFDATFALRGDYNDIVEKFFISPRAAFVFKPSNAHTFRATYNRAFSSPGTNSLFLDIIAGNSSGIDVRGRGAGQGFTWERNAAFTAVAGSDLVASSLNGCFPVATAACGALQPVGLPLDATYASVYAGIKAIPAANLAAILQAQGIPVNAALVGQLVTLLDPQLTQVQGFSRGLLGRPNLSTGGVDIISDLDNIKPLEQTVTQTVEAGYKGIFNNRVLFTIDAYYTGKEDFVGPLLMETPLVLVPTLGNDLTGAIKTGLDNNALFLGALDQLRQLGINLTTEQVAGLLVGLAADQLPSASTPVAIVQAAENNPGVGQIPELMLSYRNFGTINFWGVDASVQILATDQLNIFGNLSYVSDDFFDNTELREDNVDLAVALNAPTLKLKLGGSYETVNGLSLNLSGRYTEGFPVRSGPYVGVVDNYFLLDIGGGYNFARYAPGLRVDLGISNILNNEHREFIGAPQIGRMGILRLTYSL